MASSSPDGGTSVGGGSTQSLPPPDALLPANMSVPALVIRVDRANRSRVVQHPSLTRPDSWHGHITLTLVGPEHEKFSLGFGPDPASYAAYEAKSRLTPQSRHKAISTVQMLWKNVAELTKRFPGSVLDETARYHDAARIHPLTLQQWGAAKDMYAAWKENPPAYRALGWANPNCVAASVRFMKNLKLNVPRAWRIFPWPVMVGLTIELASAVQRSATLSQLVRPSVINIPARETLHLWNTQTHLNEALTPH